ncbi:hypothetical protein OG218_01620 [Kineococcus sp. NBC_00420]|uniref:hypothetical protein n=1 Tax=Kineococcus sp. NBC_00420 TaxID=2903564 RepID=UPI002E237B24
MSEFLPDLSANAFGLPDSAFGLATLGSAEGADESRRLQASAENLLGKAFIALGCGDQERLVTRALALPFDDHEQVHPTWWAAHTFLYSLLAHEVETLPDDEHAWLDAAAAVLSPQQGAGGRALRGVLNTLTHTGELSVGEARRCGELSRGVTEDVWWDAPVAEVTVEAVLDVLRVADAYVAALKSLNR